MELDPLALELVLTFDDFELPFVELLLKFLLLSVLGLAFAVKSHHFGHLSDFHFDVLEFGFGDLRMVLEVFFKTVDVLLALGN